MRQTDEGMFEHENENENERKQSLWVLNIYEQAL